MNTMLCRDNPAEAVRMYYELRERVAELEQTLDELGVTPAEAKAGVERSRAKTARIEYLEQALERIADMSVDIHGTIPPSIRIAREALGRG